MKNLIHLLLFALPLAFAPRITRADEWLDDGRSAAAATAAGGVTILTSAPPTTIDIDATNAAMIVNYRTATNLADAARDLALNTSGLNLTNAFTNATRSAAAGIDDELSCPGNYAAPAYYDVQAGLGDFSVTGGSMGGMDAPAREGWYAIELHAIATPDGSSFTGMEYVSLETLFTAGGSAYGSTVVWRSTAGSSKPDIVTYREVAYLTPANRFYQPLAVSDTGGDPFTLRRLSLTVLPLFPLSQ